MRFFSLEPKKSPEEFYNMERELIEFIDAVKNFRFVVVRGLRRCGKTSLILTGLNASKEKYIFIDCRLLSLTNASFEDFLRIIEFELSKNPLKSLIRDLEFLEIGGLIRFKFRKPEVLVRLFENLGNTVVVLDEAQELRRLKFRMDNFLAYSLDHLKVRFVVSGSQFGLLSRFLRVDDPEAPLYGRAYKEIDLKPLDKEKALEFLKLGFKDVGLEISEEELLKAVETFGGVIGWLAYFGYSYVKGERSLQKIAEKASELALAEIRHFLDERGIGKPRYVQTLKIISTLGEASWSEIKRALEAKIGKIPDKALSSILQNLLDAGIIVKENKYRIAERILDLAVRKL